MVDGHGAASGQAVGVLLKRLSDQTRRLAQQEVELAKGELAEKVRSAGAAFGLFGVASLLGLLALLTLTAALVLGIATALPAWAAALIVAGPYLAIAAMLGLAGRARLTKATPLAPVQTIKSVKEDVGWLKSRVRYARR